MAMNLLDYVQDILSDLDLDVVNSIDDTFDATQVAQILKSTYLAMMSNRNWPHMRSAIQITASGQTSLPTHMNLQEGVKELLFVNYNKAKSGQTKKVYEPVKFKESDEFLRLLNHRNSDATNVDVIVDASGIELLIVNDTAPEYFTSFDDETMVFDSYDSAVETTLQESKIQAQGYVFPDFELSDTFLPDIPREAESAFLEEAKSKAAFKLKQQPDTKAEQEARRQQRWLSRKAWRVNGGVRYPSYGRTTKK